MDNALQTTTGPRPDLLDIPVNAPEGFIGFQIYPKVPVMTKQGKVYYQELTTDSAAETGRLAGAAPNRTLLTPGSADWTATEVMKRYGATEDETKDHGGVEAADRIGSIASRRSVQRAFETAHATALLTGTTTSIAGGIIDGLAAGAKSVKRYAGRLAFVCSTSVYEYLIAQTEVKERLSWSFKDINAGDVLSANKNVFIMMLQGIFAFDAVLIGDDDQWDDNGKAVICKLPDPMDVSHKLDPVLGKTMIHMPDTQHEYAIRSFYNPIDYTNNYDAFAWAHVVQMNAGAKYIVEGLEATS